MPRDILSREPVKSGYRIAYGLFESQFFDAFVPEDGPHGALAIMIHGGFWRSAFDLEHVSRFCMSLAEKSVAVASLEYRRIGEAENTHQMVMDDIEAGIRAAKSWMKGRLTDSFRLILIGHSAGGYLALMQAGKSADIGNIIALAPVACVDLALEWRLGDGAVEEFIPEPQSHTFCPSYLHSTIPRLLIHGTCDDIIPVGLSREFMRRYAEANEPVHLIEIPGADHFDIIDPNSPHWGSVLGAILDQAFGRPIAPAGAPDRQRVDFARTDSAPDLLGSSVQVRAPSGR